MERLSAMWRLVVEDEGTKVDGSPRAEKQPRRACRKARLLLEQVDCRCSRTELVRALVGHESDDGRRVAVTKQAIVQSSETALVLWPPRSTHTTAH